MSNYRTIFKNHYHLSFDSDIHIHHIDHNRQNNSIENLIALPAPLHRQYHTLMTDVDCAMEHYGGMHCFFFQLDQIFYIENKKMFNLLQNVYERMQTWRKLKDQFDETLRECHSQNITVLNNMHLSYVKKDNGYLPSLSFTKNESNQNSIDLLIVNGGYVR